MVASVNTSLKRGRRLRGPFFTVLLCFYSFFKQFQRLRRTAAPNRNTRAPIYGHHHIVGAYSKSPSRATREVGADKRLPARATDLGYWLPLPGHEASGALQYPSVLKSRFLLK